MQGVASDAARAAAAGQLRALADAGGRAGRFRIRMVQLDSARPGGRPWDPGQLSANASRATRDPRAVAYLGELDYGASAVSVPITNAAGLLQVSPADGLASLTRTPPGELQRGGPVRYYPSGRRSFLRLVPDDVRAAQALLRVDDVARARRIAVVTDEVNYGEELGRTTAKLAARAGHTVVGRGDFNGHPDAAVNFAHQVAERRPDAVIYTGVLAPGTGALLQALGRALPHTPVVGSAGLAPDAADNPPSPEARVVVLSPFRPTSTYPARGRRILGALPAGDRRPEALYGYESMRLVLDALRSLSAKGEKPTRAALIRAAMAPRTRRAPIGSYRIERFGDVSGAGFAEYRVSRGRLAFARSQR
jgi:branched-chain amino acid transport system substrate-binding protein